MALFKKKPQPIRRSVTRQPEQSREVFSYYSSRNQGETNARHNERAKQTTKTRSRWSYLPNGLAGIGVVVSLVYTLTLNSVPKVNIIGHTGAPIMRDSSVYNQAARELLSRSWGDHFKVSFDSAKLNRDLQDKFPEISSTSVALPLIGRRPVITIRPVTPALILASDSSFYVLDSQGRAVGSVPETANTNLRTLPTVSDKSGLLIKTGQNALPSSVVAFISEIAAQLKAKQLYASQITLPAVAGELDIRLTGQPYTLRFNTASDPVESAGTYLALTQYLASQHQTPAQYIDLRVDERAYYR